MHCNISTISVKIGFGLTREISKEFYLLTESFRIVHRSLIIFQSIKMKISDPSYHYASMGGPNHIFG